MSQISVTPLTASIGARIDGVDLRQGVSEAEAEVIRQALWAHMVVVFHDQPIDVEQQKRIAGIFGTVEASNPHQKAGDFEPVVVIEPAMWQRSRGVAPPLPASCTFGEEFDGWHVDSCFASEIPRVATLRPEVLPPVGGDTCWANMAAAYEGLSPLLQTWLDTLDIVYAPPPGWARSVGLDALPKEMRDAWLEEYRPRLHPLVVRHPDSGRKIIYANPGYTVRIHGLAAHESAALLRFLFNHCFRPQYVLRHHWTMGDVVIWDELANTHLAPTDFAPHPRRLTRIFAGSVRPTAARESGGAMREPEVAAS